MDFKRRAFGASVLVIAASMVVGCGSAGTRSHTVTHARSSRSPHVTVVSAPAGLISGAQPQPNGTMWLLSANERIRTLTELVLPRGTSRTSVGVSASAKAMAQSSTGIIAVGTASASAGAVQIFSPSAERPSRTTALGGPAVSLAFGDNGTTLYVLDRAGASRSVAVLDTRTGKVVRTIGVAAGTRSIVPTPSQRAIWSLAGSGAVQETSLSTGKPIESFSVGSDGLSVALSPIGSTLYVLKGTARTANIAVVAVATERVLRVLPAAAHSMAIVTSLDGRQLYDFVGSPTYGNVQILSFAASH